MPPSQGKRGLVPRTPRRAGPLPQGLAWPTTPPTRSQKSECVHSGRGSQEFANQDRRPGPSHLSSDAVKAPDPTGAPPSPQAHGRSHGQGQPTETKRRLHYRDSCLTVCSSELGYLGICSHRACGHRDGHALDRLPRDLLPSALQSCKMQACCCQVFQLFKRVQTSGVF